MAVAPYAVWAAMMVGIDDIVNVVGTLAGKVFDRLFPDPVQAQAAKLELLKMQQSGELAKLAADTDLMKGQLAVDQAEASSGNSFAADARPLVMYGMLAIMMWGLMFLPILSYLFRVWHPELPPLPTLDISMAANIVLGMLGLGGMHTYEKIKAQ